MDYFGLDLNKQEIKINTSIVWDQNGFFFIFLWLFLSLLTLLIRFTTNLFESDLSQFLDFIFSLKTLSMESSSSWIECCLIFSLAQVVWWWRFFIKIYDLTHVYRSKILIIDYLSHSLFFPFERKKVKMNEKSEIEFKHISWI